MFADDFLHSIVTVHQRRRRSEVIRSIGFLVPGLSLILELLVSFAVIYLSCHLRYLEHHISFVMLDDLVDLFILSAFGTNYHRIWLCFREP